MTQFQPSSTYFNITNYLKQFNYRGIKSELHQIKPTFTEIRSNGTQNSLFFFLSLCNERFKCSRLCSEGKLRGSFHFFFFS